MDRNIDSVCALVSGGFDSSVMVADLANRYSWVFPVYVRSGLYWEEAELFWLRKFLAAVAKPSLRPLTVVYSSTFGSSNHSNHWSVTGKDVPNLDSDAGAVYLPGRNLSLLSAAATVCRENEVYAVAIGVLAGNPFPDATPDFFRSLNQTLAFGLKKPITILTPLVSLTKQQVKTLGRGLPLEMTFSCLAPVNIFPCKQCNKCREWLAVSIG